MADEEDSRLAQDTFPLGRATDCGCAQLCDLSSVGVICQPLVTPHSVLAHKHRTGTPVRERERKQVRFL